VLFRQLLFPAKESGAAYPEDDVFGDVGGRAGPRRSGYCESRRTVAV